MKLLKIMLVLVFVIVGLINRRHDKRHHPVPVRTAVVQTTAQTKAARTPVNPELVQNAERLTETLRRCKQTAQNNREMQY